MTAEGQMTRSKWREANDARSANDY